MTQEGGPRPRLEPQTHGGSPPGEPAPGANAALWADEEEAN